MHKAQNRAPGQRRPATDRARQPAPAPAAAPAEPMRIAKALARAGLCSRREAERWIELGRVSVNGETLKSPARDVGPKDKILVDGNPLPSAEPARLWRYHKPKGLVTTHKDPQERPTVFAALPPDMPRVISIGRLDFNTEGLLLLTNDGALARHLELPATGWLRRYRVRAHGTITQEALDKLKDGIELAGIRYGPIEAIMERPQGSNVWLVIGLREGKNREVRTILEHLGLTVNRLIRVSFGPFQLLDLEPGTVEPIKRRVLMEQLGARTAAELGLDEEPEEVAPQRPHRPGFQNKNKHAGKKEESRPAPAARSGPTPEGAPHNRFAARLKSRAEARSAPHSKHESRGPSKSQPGPQAQDKPRYKQRPKHQSRRPSKDRP